MRIILLFATICFLNTHAYSQVKYHYIKDKSKPDKILYGIKNHPKKSISRINISELIKEDQNDNSGKPIRFAKAKPVKIDLKDGEWKEFDYGRVWTLEINGSNAVSLSLIFDKFYLPEGSKLYLLNKDQDFVFGPITQENNKKNLRFSTDVIPGERIILRLYEPDSQKGKVKLSIENVVQAYRDITNFNGTGFDQSAPCHKDINCSEGNAWQDESKSVAMVLLDNNTRLCSGTLINNVCQDFTPNFLTAFHCIDLSTPYGSLSTTEIAEAENWVFRFNYRSSSCNGSDDFDYYWISGSDFRAGNSDTDFALVELSNSPSPESNVNYAGWTRSTSVPSKTVSIHHPRGDVMKISIDNDSPIFSTWPQSSTNSHWRANFDIGTVEPVSSGAGLFRQDGKLIGQLSGYQSNLCASEPQNNCFCNTRIGEYGRFDRSWTGGGTNQTRLSNWLDPNNTGAMTTNTIPLPSISGPSLVCTSNSTFNLSNLPPGAIVNWSASSNLNISSSNNQQAVIAAINGLVGGESWPVVNNGWLEANIITDCGETPIRQYFWVGRPPAPTGDVDREPISYNLSLDGVPSEICVSSASQTGDFYAGTVAGNGHSFVNHWETDAGPILTNPSPTNYSSVTVRLNNYGYRYIRVRAQNACGYSGWVTRYFDLVYQSYGCGPGGGGIGFAMQYSPNPVAETLTVEIEQDEKGVNQSNEFTVSLNDKYGKLAYSNKSTALCHEINMKSLEKGLYRLVVEKDGEQHIAKIYKE